MEEKKRVEILASAKKSKRVRRWQEVKEIGRAEGGKVNMENGRALRTRKKRWKKGEGYFGGVDPRVHEEW